MATQVDRYGLFDFDFFFESERFHFKFEKDIDTFKYFREIFGGERKVSILNSKAIDNITFQPSEPLFLELPKPYLLVEFFHPIQLAPESVLTGYIEFPISCSILINTFQKSILFDIFHLNSIKFALYGNPYNGQICRYWKSDFFSSTFVPRLFETGILEIEIQNTTSYLINLTKLVFDFSHIQIYYNNLIAKASARAKIQSESYCETEFVKPQFEEGFQQTFDLIPTKILSSSKFIMANGL